MIIPGERDRACSPPNVPFSPRTCNNIEREREREGGREIERERKGDKKRGGEKEREGKGEGEFLIVRWN